MRPRLPVATLSGAALIIVIAAAFGVLSNQPRPSDGVGASASDVALASPSAASEPAAGPTTTPPIIVITAPPTASPNPTPAPTPTPEPTIGPCGPGLMEAQVVSWEGAAGSRIATLTARNTGDRACLVATTTRSQLIDGAGTVLADSGPAPDSAALTVAPGEAIHALTRVSNVCTSPVVPAVTVRFDAGGGSVITARPVSATDVTVPPCNGPSQPSGMDPPIWSH